MSESARLIQFAQPVSMTNAIMVALALGDRVSPATRILWIVGMLGVGVVALLHARHVRARQDTRRFAPFLAFVVSTSATVAVLYGLLIHDAWDGDSPEGQVFLIAQLLGAATIGAFVLAHVREAAVCWIAAHTLVLQYAFLGEPAAYGTTLAVQSALYAVLIGTGSWCFGSVLSKRLLAQLHADEQRAHVANVLSEFEDTAHDWLWHTDGSGCFINVSSRFSRASGRSPELLAELSWPTLAADPIAMPEFAFRSLLVAVEVQGERRYWEVTGHPISVDNSRQAGWRGVAFDTTERVRARQRLEHLANSDRLTGLPNRHRFERNLQRGLASSEFVVLAIVDLNDFKAVNDTQGHHVGDAVLREVASRIQESVSPQFVARLGGDEFAVIIKARSHAAVVAEAHRTLRLLQEQLAYPVRVNGMQFELRAGIGWAVGPVDGRTRAELSKAADLALYRAKEAPGCSIQRYTRAIGRAADQRRRLLTDLDCAISKGEFHAYLQPIVDLQSAQVTSFEALVRWDHPRKGLLNPEAFIEFAETSGQIDAIGQWMLSEVCGLLGRHAEVSMSVNIAPSQLMSMAFVETVQSSIQSNGIAPNRLVLEITERAFPRSPEMAVEQIRNLQSLGVRIALDDFGTAYSTLGHLRRIEIDIVKIDRSFVAPLNTRQPAPLVGFIARLAEELNAVTVAEGIEAPAAEQALLEMGCRFGQGYLYGRPEPVESVIPRLRGDSSGHLIT